MKEEGICPSVGLGAAGKMGWQGWRAKQPWRWNRSGHVDGQALPEMRMVTFLRPQYPSLCISPLHWPVV